MAKAPTDPNAPKPVGVLLHFLTDYWPAIEEGAEELRVRAGETFELVADEAMDVLERGLAKRVKADS